MEFPSGEEIKGEEVRFLRKEHGKTIIYYADGSIETIKPEPFATEDGYLMLKLHYNKVKVKGD